jgi:hypothetical protein
MRALRGLRSVIHLDNARVSAEPQEVFVHSSFAEFLENPHLSLNFSVQTEKALERLLSRCLDCMSSITLYSKASDKLHIRYAVVNWAWLWMCSCENFAISDSIPPEWLEMYERLRSIDIDLVACFVLAFTPGSEVTEGPHFPYTMAKNSRQHFLTEVLGDDIYASEPIAQQAVLHATASLTAAILHVLKPAHLDGGGWSGIFVDAVAKYLAGIVNVFGPWPNPNWHHDAVVLALKALLRESPADFASLREKVVEHVYRSHDWCKRLFDYVCSDNV